MKIRRWSVAGLAAISLLTPVLTACGTDSDKPATTKSEAPKIPADPKEALLASTRALADGNFRFTMSGDSVTGGGVLHQPSQSAQLSMKFSDEDLTMEMDFIYIKDEAWVKIDLGELGKLLGMEDLPADKYLHLDPNKVKNEDMKVDWADVDPTAAADLFGAVTEVQKVSEGVYSGKVDLTKATDSVAVDEETVKALGAEATALPFEAKLDAQGRLTEVTIKVPAAGDVKAHEVKITYSDYGSASSLEAPAAGEVMEASEATYKLFE